MSMKENKALVCRFVEEFWSRGNMAAADELMTADATIFLPGRGQVNKEDFKAFALTLRSAFPDWNSTPEELVAEEDRVAERWTGRGTHQGAFQGISPTGRQVAVPGFVFYRVTSGKIVEFRGLFDGLSMLHQLGAMAHIIAGWSLNIVTLLVSPRGQRCFGGFRRAWRIHEHEGNQLCQK